MVKTLKKFFLVNQQKNPLIIGCVSALGEFKRNNIIVLLWKVNISSSLQNIRRSF